MSDENLSLAEDNQWLKPKAERARCEAAQHFAECLRKVQGRARFLLDLPSDKVVLDPLYRRTMERVLRCDNYSELWDEDEEMVGEILEATERETLLRGEKWEGGGL